MPAAPNDRLIATRVGIHGEIKVSDIIDLASPVIERAFNGRIQDDTYNYKGFNNITQDTYTVARYSKADGTISQIADGTGTAPTTLATIQTLTYN